jgi:signal transduction histidine kinase
LRYAVATFVVVSCVLSFHYEQTRVRIDRDAQLLLRMQANELVGQLQRNPDDTRVLEHYLDEHEAMGYQLLRLGFRVFGPERDVVLERGSFENSAIPLPKEFPDVPGLAAISEEYTDQEYPFYTMTVRAQDGGWVQAAVYTEVFARSAREVGQLYVLSIPFVLAITTLIGVAMARTSLQPIAQIIATAEQLSATRRPRHVPTTGNGDEIDRLARAFNAMMDRLAAGVERMQRFSAEVAHELRTPVSLMRNRLETALDEPRDPAADHLLLEKTLGDVDRLTGTVRAMLQLAHSEAGLDDSRVEALSLREILVGIVDFFEPVAEEASIDLRLGTSEDAVIAGDPHWLHQLFANLIDNAIKFSPAGRAVTVSVGTGDCEAIVAVEDNGPGIPAHECERIFESFHRLDGQLPGSGLGLALAREIARAHGGEVELESELGKGSRFLVFLPLAPPAPFSRSASGSHSRPAGG